MIRSTERILVTHAGSLPRPDDLIQMVYAKSRGEDYDPAALDARLPGAVAEVVRQQAKCGIDIVNDGEFGKVNFTNYARERIAGFEPLENPPASYRSLDIIARDDRRFPGYFDAHPRPSSRAGLAPPICVEPLRYIGRDEVQKDIANFKSALDGADVAGAFLPANTPGTIEHWMGNGYYKSDEEFLFAIADVMAEEYKAITDAGLMLQIDDPDLPDGWNCLPEMSVNEYRKYAGLRVEALNHALRDIPPEQVRLHVCWGSFHGPHHDDIPLRDIADLIFSVRAASYSIEASNPCHEHEWRVFEDVKLPDGATLVPGVVGHYSDFIEHPDLVAERLVRYAELVGRENVIAGTDCGIGTRVGHPLICWAKLEALAEGARRATKRLWAG
ncbi:MAG: cobalamin-independent methionine synthase II family protein [Alphaproteobacteria bacterium]